MGRLETGYHYTTLENWQQIHTEGLRPYLITREALKSILGTDTIKGVWIWENKFHGLNHIGSILFQMATKNSLEAVLLEVMYDLDDLLSLPDDSSKLIRLGHTGHLENLHYHDGSAKAYISVKPIPPKRIRLLRNYRLLEAWDGK